MIILLMGLAIILLTMVLIGWITFAKSENEAAVRIRIWKIRQDVQTFVQKSRVFLAGVGRKLRDRRARTAVSDSQSAGRDVQTHSPAHHETTHLHGN